MTHVLLQWSTLFPDTPGNADRHFISGWIGAVPIAAIFGLTALVSKVYGDRLPRLVDGLLRVLCLGAVVLAAWLFIAFGGLS